MEYTKGVAEAVRAGAAGDGVVLPRRWLPELVEVHEGTSHVGCERFCTEWAFEDAEIAKLQRGKGPNEEREESDRRRANSGDGEGEDVGNG